MTMCNFVVRYMGWVDFQHTAAVSASFVILNVDALVQVRVHGGLAVAAIVFDFLDMRAVSQVHVAFTLKRTLAGDYKTSTLLLTLPITTDAASGTMPVIAVLVVSINVDIVLQLLAGSLFKHSLFFRSSILQFSRLLRCS